MAIIIKNKAGLSEDAYVDIATADAYFSSILNTEVWEKADDALKAKALKTATNQIDSLNYIGYPYNPNQPLAFPRINKPLTDIERIKYQTRPVTVPQDILKAVLEQALWLISNQADEYENMQNNNISSYSIGDVSISFDLERYHQAKGLCPAAKQLLNKYLVRFTKLI